jgi:hypothetical protein
VEKLCKPEHEYYFKAMTVMIDPVYALTPKRRKVFGGTGVIFLKDSLENAQTYSPSFA